MIPLDIPDDWSPEQALAVYELLDALRDCVWDRYQLQLIELLAPDTDEVDTSQHSMFYINYDIPF